MGGSLATCVKRLAAFYMLTQQYLCMCMKKQEGCSLDCHLYKGTTEGHRKPHSETGQQSYRLMLECHADVKKIRVNLNVEVQKVPPRHSVK